MKLSLNPLGNLQNETTAVAVLNENFRRIKAAFQEALSRDGLEPNRMRDNLDMDSNRILNLPQPVNGSEPVRLRDLTDVAQFQLTLSAAAILAALLTVDGPGSGLDADTLDGHDSTYFAAASDLPSLDPELAALAAVVSAADKLFYFTGSGTGALIDFNSFSRSLVSAANAAAARTVLGLGTAAVENVGTSGHNLPFLDGNNQYSGQQWFGTGTLTDGATISWDCNTKQNAKVTIAGARTMSAPSNQKDGGLYTLKVIQDNVGGRLITWNGCFKWPEGGTAPTLSTAANAIDIISFVSDGTNMYGIATTNFL